jgi:hypothetical protein
VLKIASHMSLLGYRSTKPISSHSISIRYILILSPHLGPYLARVSSLQGFPPKLSVYFSSLHCLINSEMPLENSIEILIYSYLNKSLTANTFNGLITALNFKPEPKGTKT